MLKQFNTVFEAELQVIIEVAKWAYDRRYEAVSIHSENQYSIVVLNNMHSRNKEIREVIKRYQRDQDRRL